ncbi:MAG TPA: VTT domain-containing protein [Thermoanaerobaculia bacterium]|nr:VTT domain-containing protein [Thermoanaerobaculia bacterium]
MSDLQLTDSGEDEIEVPDAPRAGLWRPFLLILVVGLIAVIARVSGGAGWIDLQRITGFLEPIGRLWWAPLVAVGLYLLFNLLGLPGSVLTVASGVVWGWLAGGVIALLASTIGTAVPYLLARSHAPVLGPGIRRRAAWLHRLLEREGFTALLMLRLLPSLPYAVINYAAGFAGIPPRQYFLATLLGTIPGVFVTTWLASAIFSGDISLGGAFLRIAIAGGIIGAIVLAVRGFTRSK